MRKAKREMDDDFDEFEPFADRDFELDGGASSMLAAKNRAGSRRQAAWQRLEEQRDVRRLRRELEDWEDWDSSDTP
jgi:hypothetical protein